VSLHNQAEYLIKSSSNVDCFEGQSNNKFLIQNSNKKDSNSHYEYNGSHTHLEER